MELPYNSHFHAWLHESMGGAADREGAAGRPAGVRGCMHASEDRSAGSAAASLTAIVGHSFRTTHALGQGHSPPPAAAPILPH